MSQIQSKRVSLAQLTLHYLEAPPDNHKQTSSVPNKTIVFLHGFPQYSGAWTAQLDYFAQHYRVIAPDLPGYNLSDKPTDAAFYQIKNLIAVMAEFIAKINHDQPVYLVAHDWGGALAWPLCAFYPHLVEKLIILNAAHPSTFTREILTNPEQQRKSAYISDLIGDNAETLLTKDNFRFLKDLIKHDANHFPFSDEQLHAHGTSWQQPDAIASMLKYYQHMPLHQHSESKGAASKSTKSAPRIPNIIIKRPTLVLWGMNDAVFCPTLLTGLEDYVPTLTIKRFTNASHWLHHEIADEVNHHIEKFIHQEVVRE